MRLGVLSRHFGDFVGTEGRSAKLAQTVQSLALRCARRMYVTAHACGSSCSLICCSCNGCATGSGYYYCTTTCGYDYYFCYDGGCPSHLCLSYC
jgi:hypothetical protein